MRINHNLAAANTHRQLTSNTAAASKSLEKLSSGLRINRAGDDAAGLAISEKMRAQIRGLDMASKNAQDGISLIQTAEGALNETHSILQRMRELADQSANGTNTTEDRKNIQDEVNQLKSEIDRIGNTTEFNTQKLLNGALNGAAGDSSVNVSSAAVFKGTKGNLTGVSVSAVDASTGNVKYDQTDALIVDGKKIDVAWNKYLSADDKAVLEHDWSGTNMTSTESHKVRDILEKVINQAIDDSGTGAGHVNITDATAGTFKIESSTKGTASKVELYLGDASASTNAKLSDGVTDAAGSKSVFDTFLGATAELVGAATQTDGDWQTVNATTAAQTFTMTYNGQQMQVTMSAVAAGSSLDTLATAFQTRMNAEITTWNTNAGKSQGDEGFLEDIIVKTTSDGRLTFQAPSGDLQLSEEENQTVLDDQGLSNASREAAGAGAISFQIGANKGQTIALGISDMRASALGISGVDVSSASGAAAAITSLDKAITSVSSERSKMGAVQNRLEHTINNLQTSSENLTAAESRIRDVDMAKEMMDFTKNNILSQAAQAMLAQANQQPQGVLQLLR
ncbi:flagellin N-terminal helical domain-containing protein [Paenibacillus roseipurpureus]|uniref:Flagellin n=1 Tax=Paenibacillus roseopurpureus TaxID=2918901 RepID=A0AA96LQE2_9BACL|nr:flagellin [Paenibacillus sp. MBLB1832]WNR44696.1 flagellin [Paenibacillus sp. MBLB1832]